MATTYEQQHEYDLNMHSAALAYGISNVIIYDWRRVVYVCSHLGMGQ